MNSNSHEARAGQVDHHTPYAHWCGLCMHWVVDCVHVIDPLPIKHVQVDDPCIRSLAYDRYNGRLEVAMKWNAVRRLTHRLERFDQLVLTAVSLLADAYGVSIRAKVEEAYGKRVRFGPVYSALDRMEYRGYLSAWMSEPIAERGGRAKRCYRLNHSGEIALKEYQPVESAIFDAIADGGKVYR